MRTSTAVLALPALASAQQFPFLDQVKGYYSKAQDAFSSVLPSMPSGIPPLPVPNPYAAAGEKIAALNVERITLENHKELLKPGAATASPGIEDWMVFITGGNKTCFGMCERSETAWNESTALIAASPSAPHLGMLDCETDGVLCHAWALSPPNVMYIQLPQPLADQSTPATTVRAIMVNRTTVTAPEIAAIHLQEKYKESEPYEGLWHPFDGPLAKAGLSIPVGYAIYYFSKIPSWAFMIGVSFLSRNVMSRRMQGGAGGRPAGAPAGAPAART